MVTNEDNMVMMARYPDKFFDLAVVDPPYGIGMNEGNSNYVKKLFSKKDKTWDNKRPSKKYFQELFRVSKNQIIFGANYFVENLQPSMGWLCWFKTYECVDRDYSECEFIFTSFQKATRIITVKPFQKNGERIHPTQKPVELYDKILKTHTKPGDKILDTHLGSGSSRIAAYLNGFDFYGCEIDKDYFDEAEKRFKQYTGIQNLLNLE